MVREIIKLLDMDKIEELFCAYEGTTAASLIIRNAKLQDMDSTLRLIDEIKSDEFRKNTQHDPDAIKLFLSDLERRRDRLSRELWPETKIDWGGFDRH